ncbi:MAG: hypothetical protein ACXWU2_04065 [Allosphingosinicella sp.]
MDSAEPVCAPPPRPDEDPLTRYPAYRPLFAAALDPRLHRIDHLDALLASGRAQFWSGDAAALVTELRTFPAGATAICVLVAAGDKDEIVGRLRPRAEQWARDQAGCSLAIVESRPGWQRALRPHGYAAYQVALVKAL